MSSFVIRHEWCGGGDNNSIMNRYYWYGMVWYGMVWYGMVWWCDGGSRVY